MNKTAPFPYLGGKGKQLDNIFSVMPTRIYHLVDVFGGAGNVTFGASHKASIRTYNDIDGHLVNFMRCLRDKPEELIISLELTLHSRAEYKSALLDEPGITDIERARRTFVLLTQSIGRNTSQFGGWSTDITVGRHGMSQGTHRILSRIKCLPELIADLRKVQIEQLEYQDILTKYASPSTFFYLDPPYLAKTRTGNTSYKQELNKLEQHEELISHLLSTACEGWAFSCYDHPLYEKLFSGYPKHQYSSTTNFGKKRIETVYYHCPTSEFYNLFNPTND